MKKYYMVEEDTLAKELGRSLRQIQEKMFEISQEQTKKKWLVISLNKRYIFYNSVTIDKLRELHSEGYGEGEILEKLQKYDLRTRAEVKVIIETLSKLERLDERKITVKERQDKQRYLD